VLDEVASQHKNVKVRWDLNTYPLKNGEKGSSKNNFKVHRNSLTSWKSESDAEGSQGQLVQKQKFTYILERESKREWSKGQSLSNQQVHIQSENQKAR